MKHLVNQKVKIQSVFTLTINYLTSTPTCKTYIFSYEFDSVYTLLRRLQMQTLW